MVLNNVDFMESKWMILNMRRGSRSCEKLWTLRTIYISTRNNPPPSPPPPPTLSRRKLLKTISSHSSPFEWLKCRTPYEFWSRPVLTFRLALSQLPRLVLILLSEGNLTTLRILGSPNDFIFKWNEWMALYKEYEFLKSGISGRVGSVNSA